MKGNYMFTPMLGYVLLFVNNPIVSSQFYGKLFDLQPIVQAADFVLFMLPNGVKLGLWARSYAQPAVQAFPGASEICFSAEDVDALYDEWCKRGITIIQTPCDMDFGRTFAAVDPDDHRIRIYKLKK
jgi:predicted enzyme related to lactoylglutathione lyase